MCEIKAVPDDELKDNMCKIEYYCFSSGSDCVHQKGEGLCKYFIIGSCESQIAQVQALTKELRKIIGEGNANDYLRSIL